MIKYNFAQTKCNFSEVFFTKMKDIPFSFFRNCAYVYEWWLRVYWSLIDYLQTFRQRLKTLASIVLKALILDKCWQVFVFVPERCLHQFIQRLVNINETIEDNVDFHLITNCYHVCFFNIPSLSHANNFSILLHDVSSRKLDFTHEFTLVFLET